MSGSRFILKGLKTSAQAKATSNSATSTEPEEASNPFPVPNVAVRVTALDDDNLKNFIHEYFSDVLVDIADIKKELEVSPNKHMGPKDELTDHDTENHIETYKQMALKTSTEIVEKFFRKTFESTIKVTQYFYDETRSTLLKVKRISVLETFYQEIGSPKSVTCVADFTITRFDAEGQATQPTKSSKSIVLATPYQKS